MNVILRQVAMIVWPMYLRVAVDLWQNVDGCHVQEGTGRYQKQNADPEHQLGLLCFTYPKLQTKVGEEGCGRGCCSETLL